MSIDSARLYYALNPQIFCSYDIVYLLYIGVGRFRILGGPGGGAKFPAGT